MISYGNWIVTREYTHIEIQTYGSVGLWIASLVEKSTMPTPPFYTTGGFSYHAPVV